MGESKRKLDRESDMILFDPKGIRFNLGKTERKEGKEADAFALRAFATVVHKIIETKFVGGMDRRDARLWNAWLDIFIDEVAPVLVIRRQIAWLDEIVTDDNLKVDVKMSMPREAVADYLIALRDAEAADLPRSKLPEVVVPGTCEACDGAGCAACRT